MITSCQICGKKIKTTPARIKEGRGKYCSRDCYKISKLTGFYLSCKICNRKFYIGRAGIKYGKKYCSYTCRDKGLKKGKTVFCKDCGKPIWQFPKLKRKYCSLSCAGKHSRNLNNGGWNKGIPRPKLSITKRLERSLLAKRGKDHPQWKGGITKKNEIIRKSLLYRLWRDAVFKRDNYTCKKCNKRGGCLNADHIKPFSLYPKLRFDVNNGRTLCLECHKTTETYGGKIYAYKPINFA